MIKQLRYELKSYKKRRPLLDNLRKMHIKKTAPTGVRRKLDNLSYEAILEMLIFLTHDYGVSVTDLAEAIHTQSRIIDKIIRGEQTKITRTTAYMLVLIFLDNRE